MVPISILLGATALLDPQPSQSFMAEEAGASHLYALSEVDLYLLSPSPQLTFLSHQCLHYLLTCS